MIVVLKVTLLLLLGCISLKKRRESTGFAVVVRSMFQL